MASEIDRVNELIEKSRELFENSKRLEEENEKLRAQVRKAADQLLTFAKTAAPKSYCSRTDQNQHPLQKAR
jgi:cell shape-determining protein MreC